ncbi:lipolytic protein G-D-S-L family [Kribbella flavida DSM 17836]|uniref:Lipolytic protein G-D-S-L family n=1 Tax=Kribbella flavida (strain DSM 17836 / JCM 10339 / NBRC 14399) TaxID=479435 RepID=D2PT05_KRIFD|nr:SGNH/GDSL hydrolase family protein [Kribbella flavida]ADB35057.1 lipolytic protein G-D-S-L family [Kribbella flavida DSM 17836]
MRISRSVRSAAVAAAVSLAGSALVFTGTDSQVSSSGPGGRPEWVGSWSTGVTRPEAAGFTATGLTNQSARYVVRASAGGDQVRIRFSNIYGDRPVRIGAATVAFGNTATPVQSDIDVASKRALTFGGRPTAVMNKGAELLSDPVALKVPDLSTLVISVYYPAATGPTSWHASSNQQNFFGPGDLTDAADGTPYVTTRACCWTFLSGVDVRTERSDGAVVVLGDSIADGTLSTLNANNRWPDQLAERLATDRRPGMPGVLNVGLAGNRLNRDGTDPILGGPGVEQLGLNAPARLNEDVYGQTKPKAVITHLGINDLWMDNAPADQIIATLRQINAQLRQHGIRSIGATITPYEGFATPGGWTAEKEATRQAVNQWLRGQHEFDGLVDFDKAVRDPGAPSKLRPEYDGGDHIHLNDTGYQAMADAVPLHLVR